MRNTFGNILRLTTFGESHGPAIGGVLDGFPAGVAVSPEVVQRQLDRRRPGQSHITTARRESDTVQLLSGIFEGQSLGTPIGFIIPNTDHRSADYSEIAHCYRPSHADYTYQAKYGIRDYRGGGRSSARETACRVVAGALAQQALQQVGVTITAYTSQIADVKYEGPFDPQANVDANLVRCPDAATAQLMTQAIEQAQAQGDTVGGTVSCVIAGVPAGLGEPVFGRLNAQLADAMMGINAAKGFEMGLGFDFVNHRGSEVLDHFVCRDGQVATLTNHSGGVQGGISNGQDITFRVAFKPVATLMRDIDTIDDQGRSVTLHARGRHDPCVVPRAVPIVEAMAALVILDNLLLQKTARL